MLLKTFLRKLVAQPVASRHDSYDGKDILEFKKVNGFFPYIEFQSVPEDGVQEIYFDVLNWGPGSSPATTKGTTSFLRVLKLHKDNQLSVIDEVNTCLQAFYMLK